MPRDPRLAFALAVTVIVAVHASTVTLSPTIWYDEAQIIELGRAFRDLPVASSAVWSFERGASIMSPSYLGPVLQETGWRVTHSPAGPRLLSLLGAALAAALAAAWLQARGCGLVPSLGAGLALLLDPLFTGTYRGARIDSWAFAAAFGACWAASEVARARTRPVIPAAAAGVLSAVTPMVWPWAALLLPLGAVELYRGRSGADPATRRSATMGWAIGFVAGGALLALPLLARRHAVIAAFGDLMLAAHTVAELPSWSSSARALALSPWLVPAAVCVVTLKPLRAFAATFASVAAYMVLATPYPGRFAYLLPYAVGLLAAAASARDASPAWVPRLCRAALLCAVVWGALLSLGVRTALAVSQRDARRPERLVAAAREAIGERPGRVLLGTWHLYYAGRALGWRSYWPYRIARGDVSRPLPGEIRAMEADAPFDLAVFEAGAVTPDLVARMERLGLFPSRVFGPGGASPSLPLGSRPYGPFLVFTRRVR